MLHAARWIRIGLVSIVDITSAEIRTAFIPRDQRIERYCHLARSWGRRFLRGNRISIEGADLIPRNKAVILASNHQSSFDIPLFHALIPVIFRWMSGDKFFSWPFIGRALRSMGAISVAKDKPARIRRAWEQAIATLRVGGNIAMFPEGTWGDREGRMLKFKRGVIRIAREANVPVVPITIMGSNEVNPPFTKEIHPGEIRMIVHSPLRPDSWEGLLDDEWLDILRNTIGAPLEHGSEPAQRGN
jgi:1-acyl-sn-glycerol-3-phosphate acyltransferase